MTPERLAEINLDELERLARAAITEDDWGYAYDDFTDAWQPSVAHALIAHIHDLEAQLAAARDIINEIRSEAQRTIDWNQTRGMRPATDTSMFTGSYGAAVRVARMITAAIATATQPSDVDGFGDLIGSTPSLPWPRWDATPPSPEVGE